MGNLGHHWPFPVILENDWGQLYAGYNYCVLTDFFFLNTKSCHISDTLFFKENIFSNKSRSDLK